MTPSLEQISLGELVRLKMVQLLNRLGSHRAPDLYHRVIEEVERALLVEVMSRVGGRQCEACQILGLHRNTLRLRLRALGLLRPRATARPRRS
jgi:two-component system nitrogen regulation response regulator GlnG